MNETNFSKTEILSRAKLKWDSKDNANRVRAGSKYKHLLNQFNLKNNDWINNFDDLSKSQRTLIIKGELIRTYDSLSNSYKTDIMRKLGLSVFSSKWYKLPGKDKKILLNYVIK